MTNDVGYVTPCLVDYILPNTRVKFDINTASFTNPTVAPLYGRYKVKYLAFWAPHRLYMREWLNGSAVEPGDDFHYPIIKPPMLDYDANITQLDLSISNLYRVFTGNGYRYNPPTSLLEYLGVYPAYLSATDFGTLDDYSFEQTSDDLPTPSSAFSFLAFWDIYRNFILNVQEPYFPVRRASFADAYNSSTHVIGTSTNVPTSYPYDVLIEREWLDDFFDDVKAHNTRNSSFDVSKYWFENLVDLYPFKEVFSKYQWDYRNVEEGIDEFVALRGNLAEINERLFIRHSHNHYLQPFSPYLPDAFSSWISNENVEVERIKSKMIVNNNEIYMDQWKIASRIQNMVRKSLFKNSDFAEYMDVQYGVRPSTGISKPMFLGAFVSDIIFNDVISSAQIGSGADPQNNDALGSRAGYGNGRDTDKKNFVDFTSKEPGTFMVLQIILPEVFYFEGRDLMYDKQNFNEEFNPEFDAIGYQDLQKSQMNMTPGLSFDPFGRLSYNGSYQLFNTAVAQQPYAMEHMVKYNQLKGMMTMPNYYQRWTLARSFNYNRGNLSDMQISPNRGYYSTYPYPEMYNNIFQNELQIDNFQFYLNFDYLKYQPILKQFLSFN